MLNDITSHTTIGGRAPYSRAERQELLQASRDADNATVKPVETAVRFESDRSMPRDDVFISSTGDVVPVDSSRVDITESEKRPAKRVKAKGLTMIDFFFKKK